MEKKTEQKKPEQLIEEIKDAYRRLFRTDDGKIVNEDLSKFCRYNKYLTDQNSKQEDLWINEGKRRVYLEIQFMMERKK